MTTTENPTTLQLGAEAAAERVAEITARRTAEIVMDGVQAGESVETIRANVVKLIESAEQAWPTICSVWPIRSSALENTDRVLEMLR